MINPIYLPLKDFNYILETVVADHVREAKVTHVEDMAVYYETTASVIARTLECLFKMGYSLQEKDEWA